MLDPPPDPEAALAEHGVHVRAFHPKQPAQRGKAYGRLRLLTVADAALAPPRRYLLHGLLGAGEFSVWWGAPKCGKSFLLLRLAFGLTVGRGMWGRVPKRPLRVLYVGAEGETGMAGRILALRAELNDPGDAFRYIAQRVEIGPPGVDLKDVIAAAKDMRADLVVLDTVARTFGDGDENSTQDMSGFIAAVDELRQDARPVDSEVGPHVAVVHHGSKDKEAALPRGSIALVAAADLVVKLARGTNGSPSTATITEAKDDAGGEVLPFSLRTVDLGLDADGEPRVTCVAEEADAPAPGPKASGAHLTDTQRGWLSDIHDLFAEPGVAVERVPVKGMQARVTLTRDQVRDGLRAKGRLGDAKGDGTLTGAERTALYKMLNALKDKGKLCLTADLVWLP